MRCYSSVKPVEGGDSVPYGGGYSNVGFAPEFFDAVNVRYSSCRALLNGVVLMQQTGGPYGARIGYLMGALYVRKGDVLTVDMWADGVVLMRAQFVAEPVPVGDAFGTAFIEYAPA